MPIDAPGLAGSINLVGRADRRPDAQAPPPDGRARQRPGRACSRPPGTPAQQFAQFGWVGRRRRGCPTRQHRVAAPTGGAADARQTPVTLTLGQRRRASASRIRFAIDAGLPDHRHSRPSPTAAPAPVTVRPFALINRTDRTASLDSWNVHSGPIGAFDGAVDFGTDYDDVAEAGDVSAARARPTGSASPTSTGCRRWSRRRAPRSTAISARSGGDIYRADLIYDPLTVAPGPPARPAPPGCSPAPRKARCSTATRTAASPSSAWRSTGAGSAGSRSRSSGCCSALFDCVGNFGVAIILLTRDRARADVPDRAEASSPAWRRCARSSRR